MERICFFYTERLKIKNMIFDDCDIVASEWGHKEYGKYLSDSFYKNGNEIRKLLKEELKSCENWTDEYYFSVFSKSYDIFIGTACVFKEKEEGVWGIGYTIFHEFWNNGYACELIAGLCKFIKHKGGLFVSSSIAKDNIASLKVCYKNDMKVFKETSFKKTGTDIVYSSYELRKKL